jgi:hypothetical protein
MRADFIMFKPHDSLRGEQGDLKNIIYIRAIAAWLELASFHVGLSKPSGRIPEKLNPFGSSMPSCEINHLRFTAYPQFGKTRHALFNAGV